MPDDALTQKGRHMASSIGARLTAALAKQDPAEVVIPRLADDPEYAAAATLLAAFHARLGRINAGREALGYEAHFERRGDPREDSDQDRFLRERWMALRKASEEPEPLSRPLDKAPAPSPAIAAGLKVLGGEAVTTTPDRATRLAELDRLAAILGDAIREQTEIRDEIAGRLSRRYSEQLAPGWNAAQLAMYRAAQELARTAEQVRDLRWRMTDAGIQPPSDLIKMPPVRAPLFLGSETDWNSEISGWRRLLEEWSIL
jgi:hypothetical protein